MAGIAALAIGYVLSQFYRSFLAVLTPVLTSELGMTKVELSVASGAWFVTFALAQFAVGVSLDRFGPRRTASILLAVGAGLGRIPVFRRDGAVDGHRRDGADRHRLLAGADGVAVHLRAQLFAGAFRGAGVVDGRVRHGRQRHRRSAAGQRGRSVRLAAGDGRAWRLHSADGGGDRRLRARSRRSRKAWRTGIDRLCRAMASCSGMRALWPIMPLTALNYAPATGIRGLWSGPYLADVYGADSLVIGAGDDVHGAGHGRPALSSTARWIRSSGPANGSRSAAIR